MDVFRVEFRAFRLSGSGIPWPDTSRYIVVDGFSADITVDLIAAIRKHLMVHVGHPLGWDDVQVTGLFHLGLALPAICRRSAGIKRKGRGLP